MQDRIKAVRNKVQKAAGEMDYLQKVIETQSKKRDEAEERAHHAQLAKELVLAVANQTQANIGTRISELVSLALASVFDDPYEFEVEFVQRAGRTEADLWFVRDGNKIEPLVASGGGPVDIASFALRLAVWTLAKTAPVFLLDEPFRNLSSDKHERAGLMLKELSNKLGIQILSVSHSPMVIAGADRVFEVESGKVKQL